MSGVSSNSDAAHALCFGATANGSLDAASGSGVSAANAFAAVSFRVRVRMKGQNVSRLQNDRVTAIAGIDEHVTGSSD